MERENQANVESLSVEKSMRLLNDLFHEFKTASENGGTGRSLKEQALPFLQRSALELRMALMTLYTNGGAFPQELLPKIDEYFNQLMARARDIIEKGTNYKTPDYIPLDQGALWQELSQALSKKLS